MNRLILAVPLAAALACSPAHHPAPVAIPHPAAPPVVPHAIAVPQLDPLAPEAVLDKLHMLDGELIGASEVAEKSAHETRVKKLATHVIEDRKKADAELVALAAKLSVNLKDATQLSLQPADKAAVIACRDDLASLGTNKADGFDARYLNSIDTAFKGELQLISQVGAKPENPDLKAYTAKLEPMVTEHEKSAAKELKAVDHKTAG